jgi:toxin FitB
LTFLLDTNVISEGLKARPEPRVVAWLAGVDEDRTYISTITIGELRHGVERLAHGRRRKRLDEWVHYDLPLRFEGRILSIDLPVAHAWGRSPRDVSAWGAPLARWTRSSRRPRRSMASHSSRETSADSLRPCRPC